MPMDLPHIILLPGLDGTGLLYDALIQSLSKELNISVISYPPNQKLDHSQLVAHVLGQLPATPFVLVAESFSGAIAHQITLKQPKNLKGIIFIASFLQTPRPVLLRTAQYLPLSRLIRRPVPDRLLNIMLFHNQANQELLTLFDHTLKQVSASVMAFRLHTLLRMPQRLQSSDQKKLSIPTLYIQASHDRLVPARCLEKFKHYYRDLETITIQDAGHLLAQTHPQNVGNSIEDFIQRI